MKTVFGKIKNFAKNYKKQIIDALVILLVLAVISVVTFVLLMAFDVIYYDDGISFNAELFKSFSTSWYGMIIFVLLHTALSMLLCVIPGASMAFIILIRTIYSTAWQAFLLSFISVMVSSSSMYVLGRVGGYRLCVKLLGEEDCKKSLGLLRDKGTVFFPLMMMFPVFPDDALVMIAGTIKMKLLWFLPSIILGSGIGIATIIFGLSIIPFDKFTTPIHWIIFILICAAFVLAVFSVAVKLNKYLEKRKK